MFCWAMEIGLLGSRIAYALKEPYILVLAYPIQVWDPFLKLELSFMQFVTIPRGNHVSIATIYSDRAYNWQTRLSGQENLSTKGGKRVKNGEKEKTTENWQKMKS